MQFLHSSAARAAWDLRHAAAVEDLLKLYMQTLPQGPSIPAPRLFIYQGKAFSRACPNSGIDAPAYCPGEHTVYLETSLGDKVAELYGDFGALSILAHEFGHAYLHKIGQHPQGKDGELAADRFAGGFARFVEGKGLLERGDIAEARATFAAVGDYEVYHHDHHGTPTERQQSFNDGYLQGFKLPNGQQQTPSMENPPSDTPRTNPDQPQPVQPVPTPATAPPAAGLPVLGLGLGCLVLVLVVAAVIAMVNRAGEDDA